MSRHHHGHHHGHSHGHPHGHSHDHPHAHGGSHGDVEAPGTGDDVLAEAVDLSVPDTDVSPAALSRRGMLRGAGLLGAGVAATGALSGTAAAAGAGSGSARRGTRYTWLAGDHHIHTQFSPDGQYRVSDQVGHAAQYGLDWMVVTDHGSEAHAKLGVEKVNPDIVAARRAHRDMLVFQGLEWNIPAAEHGTVFVAPGRHEVDVLKQFENGYDGGVRGATASTPANEALAIAGLGFLADQVAEGRTDDALMLANHPARKGIDSPHEIRAWQEARGRIAVGMEGAPGHQAGGISEEDLGPGGGRGGYDNSPGSGSFAAYPLESYRTWGGFDWMTSTVGGLWDSLLAEGRPWWITANSDSHQVYADWSVNPVDNDREAPWDAAGHTFENFGRYGDPVHGGRIQTGNSDFWPGYYSRTHVGAARAGYGAVMDGIRAGRIWVDHGSLVDAVDVRVRSTAAAAREATLGGSLTSRTGDDIEVTITVTLASGPNAAQLRPELARVDLIAGQVTGAFADRDTFTTPQTKVVTSFDTTGARAKGGTVTFRHVFRDVADPFYVHFRGTDGNRSQPGALGASVDPNGPAIDVVGDADPWTDLWFYTNPVFVVPERRGRH